MARAGVGNLPFTLLKQLVHQLPSADAIIRGIPCSKITRGEYLVNLVGDRVPIANVLEVCQIKIYGTIRRRCPWTGGRTKPIRHLARKLVGWQVGRDKFSDSLQPAILCAHMKMDGSAGLTEAVVGADEMCIPPLLQPLCRELSSCEYSHRQAVNVLVVEEVVAAETARNEAEWKSRCRLDPLVVMSYVPDFRREELLSSETDGR